jgi:hypothetical protein
VFHHWAISPAPDFIFKLSPSKEKQPHPQGLVVTEAAFAYPGQISLGKGQILLLPEWIPLENVLII